MERNPRKNKKEGVGGIITVDSEVMNNSKLKLKLSFIIGLKEIVLNEIMGHPNLRVIGEGTDSLYLSFVENLSEIEILRSISRVYVAIEDSKYNPSYISNHKSILGNLIEMIIVRDKKAFKSFKITCAGKNSPEGRSIAKYIEENWNLIEKEEADLKIHIINKDNVWEIGVQTTPRPLSVRDYKIRNMSGAMDSTIAYAMNSLCDITHAKSYLNIFSGSATLLIEAGQCYPNLERLVGFDTDKKHLSLAIQNIKEADLIKRVQIKEENIFDKPDFGSFDVITSDLPFGMSMSKDDDLKKLYGCFVEYCEQFLEHSGILVVYTADKYKMFEEIVRKSRFKIIKTVPLRIITSVNAYLRPKIFVCRLRK